jgi:hypothetical protein
MRMTPERAANLLLDDAFKNEMQYLRQMHLDVITSSSDDEIDKRESAYKMIRAIDQIYSHFQAIAETTEIKSKRWKIL